MGDAAVLTLNKILGGTVPTVGTLDEFIAKYEGERSSLVTELESSSKFEEANEYSENLEALVTTALKDLEQLEIDQKSSLVEAEAALSDGLEVYSSLLPLVHRARVARRAAAYDAIVEQVQERVVEMENGVTRQNFGVAVDSYAELLVLARQHVVGYRDERASKPPHLSRYLMETASVWYAVLKQHVVKELEDALALVKWPFTDSSGSGAAAAAALASEHFPRIESAFGRAAKLDVPPPATANGSSLPIRIMLKPLIKRFKFHFTGLKETNNREKPEWYFTQVSNWARDCVPFVEGISKRVRPAAAEECLKGLVELAVDKLYADFGVPDDFDDGEAILAHAIEEALLFDREIRVNHEALFPASDPGVLTVLTGARVFTRWLDIERKSAGEKVDKILASETAFVAEEDELLGVDDDDDEVFEGGDWKVTECADRFLSLLLSIIDRYRCLVQPGHRLQFAELQADLAEDFRVRLLQLAREERKDPIYSNLCPILNTISYILQVMVEWNDLPFFIELQHFREKCGMPSRMNDRPSDTGILDVANERAPLSGLFDEVMVLFQHSEDDLVSVLQTRVGDDISAHALEYKRDKWFASGTVEKNRISGSGCTLLNVIRDRLRTLKRKLNKDLFQKIVARVAADVAKFLVVDFVCDTRFSQDGGRQFGVDLSRGFIVVFAEFDPRPAKYFREASEAALLLNLAKGAAILLRDELKAARGEESGKNSLRELGVYRLSVSHALKIVENRLYLERS